MFVVAAVPKLADPAAFAVAIDNYRLLSPALGRWLATGLPVLELCVALGMLVPRLARGSCLLSLVMLVGFTGAMAQAMVRGINLDCGCFGASAEVGVDAWSLGRNAALCIVSCWALWTTRVPPATGPAMLPQP